MIENTGKYYLYRHIRLDKNEPFYIGIGTKPNKRYGVISTEYRRAFEKDRSNLWKKIYNKTEEKYEVEILLESDDYEFIKQKEIEFIALYGRINNKTGILANLTDGGEGVLGYIMSEESKKKMGKAKSGENCHWFGKAKTQEERDAISARNSGENHPMFGTKHTQAHRDKISKSNMGKKHTPQALENMREAQKNAPKGANSFFAKKVINTQTLEVYSWAEEVCDITGLRLDTIREYMCLTSKTKNPTFYMYLEDYEKYGAQEPWVTKLTRKEVIDTKTLEVYSSLKETSEKLKINYSYLGRMLKGKRINTTSLMYKKEYDGKL